MPPRLEPGLAQTIALGRSEPPRRRGPPLASFINPDDAGFLAPDDMPQAIRDFCQRTGQTVPQDEGAVLATAHRKPGDEVSARCSAGCEDSDRRPDRNDPHRRRRHAKPPALPGDGRRLQPPRRGRPDRSHRHRQHDDAGRRRRRRRLASPRPARSSAAVSRSRNTSRRNPAAWDEACEPVYECGGVANVIQLR